MEKKSTPSNAKLNADCVNCLKEMMECFPGNPVIAENCSKHLDNYTTQGHNYFRDLLKPEIKKASRFVNDGRISDMIREMPEHPFCSWLGNDASFYMSFEEEGKRSLCENLKAILRTMYMSTFTEGVFGEELKSTWQEFIEKNRGCDQKDLFSRAVKDKDMFSKLISSVTKNNMIGSVMSNISPILESYGPVEIEGEDRDKSSDEDEGEDMDKGFEEEEEGEEERREKKQGKNSSHLFADESVYEKDFFPDNLDTSSEPGPAAEQQKIGDLLKDVLNPNHSDIQKLFKNQSKKEKKYMKKHSKKENCFKTLSKMIESMTKECSGSGENDFKSLMEDIQSSDVDLSSLQDFSKFIDPKTGAPDISKLPDMLKSMGTGSEDLSEMSSVLESFKNLGGNGAGGGAGMPDMSAITGMLQNMGNPGSGNEGMAFPDFSAITGMFQNMAGGTKN